MSTRGRASAHLLRLPAVSVVCHDRDCIETIDGTHVTAKVPRAMFVTFRGRKHYTSQNVLGTVDFDLRFTYMLADWEGSAHDASIMSDSLSRPDGLKRRYRLNEFTARNRPRNAKELFNPRHSRLRVTIERAFAALKNMFKVIDHKPFHTFDTQVKLVLACCILHNYIVGWGEDKFFQDAVAFDEVESGHGMEVGDNEA
ncbi:protein ALP1-like [Lolium perenne]|uniref:protein ALP1-like n=1 Tax=Lolium perenne TaxID=4522 RepID=UPI0021F579F8|nr:protein ALP1-like [Lolium perenne]